MVSQSLDLGYFRCSCSNRFFEAARIAKSCKLCKVVQHTSESTNLWPPCCVAGKLLYVAYRPSTLFSALHARMAKHYQQWPISEY
jgi:hypothetical protein